MVSATANGEKDWRDECVAPVKDDRIQTAVRNQLQCLELKNYHISNFRMSLNFSFLVLLIILGRHSHKGP